MNLEFESDSFFDCQSSGQCCRTDWKIPVEATKSERLRTLGPELAISQDNSGTWHLNRQDGRCRFLTPSELCRVHGELGPEHKPLACLMFPFVLTPTPSGVHVGASFYCPSVRKRKGRALSEHLPQLQTLASRALGSNHTKDLGRLTKEQTLGWNAYQLLEEALLEKLETEVPQALLALYQGLHNHLQTWWREDLESLFPTPSASLIQETQLAAEQLSEHLSLEQGKPAHTELSRRYIRSLVRRKYLWTGIFLPRLQKLAAAELLLQRAPEQDSAIEALELLLTHTR